LNASIKTTKRVIEAEKFFAVKGEKTVVLDDNEIVVEIRIPVPEPGTKGMFIKFALRKSIDFPVVNCAAAIKSEGGMVKGARICLNAVYSNPYRAVKAEESIKGKAINEANAETAGLAAVSDALAMPYNKYKIQVAKTLVKRAILGCK
jgi:xanthine dehydrogenase YagS FAD-binding subunit